MAKKKISHVVTDPAELAEIERKKEELKQKRKERQIANTKDVEVKAVMNFLEQTMEAEPDALRATIHLAQSGVKNIESIPTKDRRLLNAYLNTGYSHYSTYVKEDEIRKLRKEQEKRLRSSARCYLSVEEFYRAFDTLDELVVCDEDVKKFAEKRKAITNPLTED